MSTNALGLFGSYAYNYEARRVTDGPAVPQGREPASVNSQSAAKVVVCGGPDPRPPAPADHVLLHAYGRARSDYQHEEFIDGDSQRQSDRASTLAGLRAVLAQFGGGIPQLPAPGEVAELARWLRTHASGDCDEPQSKWVANCTRLAELIEQHFATAAIDSATERQPLPTDNLAPVPVADRPWERPGWCDANGRCWWTDDRQIWWTEVDPTQLGQRGWVLPHWAIPAVPAIPAADPANPAEVQP